MMICYDVVACHSMRAWTCIRITLHDTTIYHDVVAGNDTMACTCITMQLHDMMVCHDVVTCLKIMSWQDMMMAL